MGWVWVVCEPLQISVSNLVSLCIDRLIFSHWTEWMEREREREREGDREWEGDRERGDERTTR